MGILIIHLSESFLNAQVYVDATQNTGCTAPDKRNVSALVQPVVEQK